MNKESKIQDKIFLSEFNKVIDNCKNTLFEYANKNKS
jgi:hypothetical protein